MKEMSFDGMDDREIDKFLVIGESYLCYDSRNNEWRKAKILRKDYDYVCCKGMPGNEHTHVVCVDVDFGDRVSRGHFPTSFRIEKEA